MRHARAGRQTSANRLHDQVVVRLPQAFREDSRAMAAHVDGGGNFKKSGRRVRDLHKHLQRDAVLRPAQKGVAHEQLSAQPKCLGEDQAGGYDAILLPSALNVNGTNVRPSV